MTPVAKVKSSAWASSILHADMDAFYASVEILGDPALAGKPVIVGGTSSRGVVTSASYEARKFGVRSAMPTTHARRICPGGIFIQPNFGAYSEKSRQVRSVFDSFSHVVEPLSLDEAFLDLESAARMWPNPPTLAEALKDQVYRRTGLVVSVGVAPNKFLAKLASKQAKPDGIVIVAPGRIEEFLNPISVRGLWGVGEQTANVLERLGLRTIGDVAAIPAGTLERAMGSVGLTIAQLARGNDRRPVTAEAPCKSMGAEETFEQDLVEESQIARALLKLSDRVASRLRAHGVSAQTITVKVRFANFTTTTRSHTLRHEIDNTAGIYETAVKLLGRLALSRTRIRLLGVSASKLSEWPASVQLGLKGLPGWSRVDKAVDQVRMRFGESALGFGSFLDWRD